VDAVVAVAECQVSADIAVAVDVSVLVSAAAAGVYSSGRPRSHVFPSIDYSASSSSSAGVGGLESVHSSTGVHTNYDFDSVVSNGGQYQNKNLEHGHNKPIPGHNNVIDTTGHSTDATTNRTSKTYLPLYQEQRTHSLYQASLSQTVVPEIQRVVAAEYQFRYLHLLLPYFEWEQQLSMPERLCLKAPFSFCCLLFPVRDTDPKTIFLKTYCHAIPSSMTVKLLRPSFV